MEYPRADHAVIVDAESGERKELIVGDAKDALYYGLQDMEEAIRTGNKANLHLQDSVDVMELMTKIRNDWGLKYPEEQ